MLETREEAAAATAILASENAKPTPDDPVLASRHRPERMGSTARGSRDPISLAHGGKWKEKTSTPAQQTNNSSLQSLENGERFT
mmetsp:Transcript_23290/g.55078  ORF Transcript_23290/g.55078 Transcript_23290/m.55078 type:complete len:84 (-) Transcript_23290:2265-2516(-)